MSAHLLKQILTPYKLVEKLRFAIFSHQMFNLSSGMHHPMKRFGIQSECPVVI
jgi:hypothetical protein